MIVENSSFRDYCSIVGYEGDNVKRLIHKDYLPHYDRLVTSGLYNALTEKNFLVSHKERESKLNPDYPIELLPDKISFISYPYEWTFNQLKDAAILILKINKIAIEYGMILKDASAFNVQFVGPRPVFIDTASFIIYEEGQSWGAYQQFCRHFLAPLALSYYRDFQLNKLLLANIDGIPLIISKKILPLKSIFNSGIFLHIWLNSFGQNSSFINRKKYSLSITQSKQKLLVVQDHLLLTLEALNRKIKKSKWSNYYENSNYSQNDDAQKEMIVRTMVRQLKVKSILDLGANEGRYSRLLAQDVEFILSTDYDEIAIDRNYEFAKSERIKNLQTLHLDVVNPTPSIGFSNKERKSFLERVRVDLVLALALVHHLTITHDIHFEHLAEQFAKIAKYLVIEFPDREDEKVLIIAKGKPNQYQNYRRENFESAFGNFYDLKYTETIHGNGRLLYCYERKV